MGEGWGDFFAVSMTSQAATISRRACSRCVGLTDVAPSFKDNYYFSIRRYPYSADMKKNPLTFKHIGESVVLPVDPRKIQTLAARTRRPTTPARSRAARCGRCSST